MLRVLKRLSVLRNTVLSWCKKYERDNRTLFNVVNCRAYYILLNAVDHQIYSILSLAFDVPTRDWKFAIFEFKLRQLWYTNKQNKYRLHQNVYHHILQHLRFYEQIYQPSLKEIRKFKKISDVHGWTCAGLWRQLTNKNWKPEVWVSRVFLDDYVPPCRRHFENVVFDNSAKIILFHFFCFDYHHYVLCRHKSLKLLLSA